MDATQLAAQVAQAGSDTAPVLAGSAGFLLGVVFLVLRHLAAKDAIAKEQFDKVAGLADKAIALLERRGRDA